MTAALNFVPQAPTLDGWLAAIGPHWLAAAEAGLPATALPSPEPLARLTAALDLAPPDVALVELLAAVECDAALAARIAGQGGVPMPLVRQLVPAYDPAGLGLIAQLRAYEVVRLSDGPRSLAVLRIGEALFDRLCGAGGLDPAVASAARACVLVQPAPRETAAALGNAFAERGADGLSPLVVMGGATLDTAAAACAAIGLVPFRLVAAALPADPAERARWSRLWARDAALMDAVLIVDGNGDQTALADIVDAIVGHVVMAGELASAGFARPVRVVGPVASADGGLDRWQRAFGERTSRRLTLAMASAARRFRLDATQLSRLAGESIPRLAAEPDDVAAARLLWRAAARAVPPLPVTGAVRREAEGEWDDLVLAPPLKATLRRIEAHVRYAEQVMQGWGFARRMGGRGTGVAALFAGPSGTGKTLAAEIIAAALDLPMLVIDLAQLTSKYIGETSKNIAAAFAEAERTGAVMVWNEGDAIFGARGQVSNATDRHVNAEVGDLLQRIEAFTGFTVVTTNMKSAIDPAFLRRFRFVVDFPMPSENERRTIWEHAFPPATPLNLAPGARDRLATVALTGGAIRNAALGAAFSAAAAGQPVDFGMIAEALAAELAKTGQPMPVLA